MTKFLSQNELYTTILEKSSKAKDTLWVCSPVLGTGAHKIFSQETIKNPPADIRFIFQLNEHTTKTGKTDPYEIQYFIEHFRNSSVKSQENFSSAIYIFDDSALVTSANLTLPAFESYIETGVLLEGTEAAEAQSFFDTFLWNTAKPIGALKKYKVLWNLASKSHMSVTAKKIKAHTEIKDWPKTYVDTWYVGVSKWISAKTVHKIRKEMNWHPDLFVVGDIGYQIYTQLKVGDYAYIADLTKRGGIEIIAARIYDKARIETDEGDFHCIVQKEKGHALKREQFFELMKKVNIRPKSESLFSEEQLKQISDRLSSIKQKNKRKSSVKSIKTK
jgi:hypothetical protein